MFYFDYNEGNFSNFETITINTNYQTFFRLSFKVYLCEQLPIRIMMLDKLIIFGLILCVLLELEYFLLQLHKTEINSLQKHLNRNQYSNTSNLNLQSLNSKLANVTKTLKSKDNCQQSQGNVSHCVEPKWCRPQHFRSPPGKVTGLISFPGSGNTWLRYLIQQLSGIKTGSVYSDKELNRTGMAELVKSGAVAVVKDHRKVMCTAVQCFHYFEVISFFVT